MSVTMFKNGNPGHLFLADTQARAHVLYTILALAPPVVCNLEYIVESGVRARVSGVTSGRL